MAEHDAQLRTDGKVSLVLRSSSELLKHLPFPSTVVHMSGSQSKRNQVTQLHGTVKEPAEK
jgi:hypothetical protein